MRYCVIKNTTKIIDGSDNPVEILLQNAQNAGFTETDVEIITEEEYLVRKELEPKPEQEPTEIQMLRDYVLDIDYRLVIMELGL